MPANLHSASLWSDPFDLLDALFQSVTKNQA